MTIDVDHIDHFQRRVLQDALASATALYWCRRADAFEWARPRPTDDQHRGTSLPPVPVEITRAVDQRCAAAADACRRQAALAKGGAA